MKEAVSKIAILFQKYYGGTATIEETNELMELINTSQYDSEMYQLLEEAWRKTELDADVFSSELSQNMLDHILDTQLAYKEPTRTLPIYKWMKYAATVLIILGIGLGISYWQRNQKPVKLSDHSTHEILPGGHKAALTLADGTIIPLDSLSNGKLAEQGGVVITKTENGKLVYKVVGPTEGRIKGHLNSISTPRGGQYEIELPDGSIAWLNASSTMRFPTEFAKDERKVEIEGEVYFEIKKDIHRPFKVRFGPNEIDVLGTHFNVMYYSDEDLTAATLIEGSVLLNTSTARNQLKPGQQALVKNTGQTIVKTVDTDKILAWKNGFFHFEDDGIQSVMRQVSRWYDIEVVYEGTPTSRQLTGKVSREVGISELMEMLQYAGIKYRIEGKRIIVSN
ncbi:FecR protein [Dyadobacter jejuensis]|uniref:FecR protein n=1 Tax=Dyadobacter jejuensis TaxID=1082580 RepID=A0A316APA5_9BACT|nr:FecR domain-containing protein [Dyadobacter jejuensis]PWJ58640.1 FecR protein [Dyadobacter jejuensis]